jgi:8-oxo-dGTP pyrophosphatase MutT (NUDIX family)
VLFDGATSRLEGFTADASGLELRLSQTSYKIFLGTNLTHPELAEAHGRAILADSLGVGTPVLTSDGFIVLGRRNHSVVCYPGRSHPFAGALEPRDDDPFLAARRELSEEAGVNESDLISIRCIGIAEDQRIRQPELVLRADVRSSRARIAADVARDEHHDIHAIVADRASVAAAVNDPLLTPVGAGALLLWGRSQWGEDWLAQTVKDHCPAA